MHAGTQHGRHSCSFQHGVTLVFAQHLCRQNILLVFLVVVFLDVVLLFFVVLRLDRVQTHMERVAVAQDIGVVRRDIESIDFEPQLLPSPVVKLAPLVFISCALDELCVDEALQTGKAVRIVVAERREELERGCGCDDS